MYPCHNVVYVNFWWNNFVGFTPNLWSLWPLKMGTIWYLKYFTNELSLQCRDAMIHILSVLIYHLFCIMIQQYGSQCGIVCTGWFLQMDRTFFPKPWCFKPTNPLTHIVPLAGPITECTLNHMSQKTGYVHMPLYKQL